MTLNENKDIYANVDFNGQKIQLTDSSDDSSSQLNESEQTDYDEISPHYLGTNPNTFQKSIQSLTKLNFVKATDNYQMSEGQKRLEKRAK